MTDQQTIFFALVLKNSIDIFSIIDDETKSLMDGFRERHGKLDFNVDPYSGGMIGHNLHVLKCIELLHDSGKLPLVGYVYLWSSDSLKRAMRKLTIPLE